MKVIIVRVTIVTPRFFFSFSAFGSCVSDGVPMWLYHVGEECGTMAFHVANGYKDEGLVKVKCLLADFPLAPGGEVGLLFW